MALPPGLTPKTVTVGVASFTDGSLAEGTATITAPVNLVHGPTNRPIFSSQISKRFENGMVSFDLLPTDAPGLNRVDWTYVLRVVINGALVQPEPIWFVLPTAGPDEIDLDSLVTVPSSAGTPISVDVLTSAQLPAQMATVAADTDSDFAVAQRAAFVPKWKPNTAYAQGEPVVNPSGQLVTANSAFTSGGSYVAGNWTVTAGGGGGAATTDASLLTSGTLAPARIADNSLPVAKLTGTLSDAQIPASIARDTEVASAVAALVASAPATLDTLDELAAALGDDANFAASTATALGNKVNTSTYTAGLAAKQDTATLGATVAADSTVLGAFIPRTDTLLTSALLATKRPAMTPPAARAPALIAATGHGYTGGVDDTTIKLIGDRSRKQTTNGTGGAAYFDNPGLGGAQDWSKYSLRARFRVDDVTKLNVLAVNVESAAGNGSYGLPLDTVSSGEWVTVTIPRSAFGGTPNWSAITKVNAYAQDKSAGAVNAWFHGIDLVPDMASVAPNGIFILECDDLYTSQKSLVLPVADSLGVPITFAPIVERVTGGTAGFTVADMKALQRNGHAFVNHAFSSAFHGTGGNAAAWEADFLAQQRWFDDNGLPWGALHYAMCQGTGNYVAEGAQMDVLRKRFRSVRQNGGYYQAVVPGDPHKLPSRLFTGDSNSILTGLIDKAAGVTGGGGAGVFTLAMHEAVAGGTNGTASGIPAIAIDNLKTVLQYARTKGMVFMTRPDYLALVGL